MQVGGAMADRAEPVVEPGAVLLGAAEDRVAPAVVAARLRVLHGRDDFAPREGVEARRGRVALAVEVGLGPEVVDETLKVLEALRTPDFNFTESPCGAGCYLEHGDPLPKETVQGMRKIAFGTIRRNRSDRLRRLDHHNFFGIVALAWMLVIGLTGAINAFADPLTDSWRDGEVARMTASYAGTPSIAPQDYGSLDAAMDAANRALPGWVCLRLRCASRMPRWQVSGVFSAVRLRRMRARAVPGRDRGHEVQGLPCRYVSRNDRRQPNH